MGHYIGAPFWENGYVTSAIRQVCEYVFENTDIIRIFAEPFAHNKASCRALEKAGFQYEGTLKSNAVKCGSIVVNPDPVLYGRGLCFHVFVYNVQPGIEIDYRNGESRVA